ncbi:MAG: hypothetical protein JSV92_01285 [archaeon]|nr:MAG: hypothetical protein JSV92_01285 [archaeon]
MVEIVMVLLVLGVILGLVTTLLYWKKKKSGEPMEPNYYVFFVVGFVWFPIGVVFMSNDSAISPFFFIMGLVYIAIGLSHRDKWPENKRKIWVSGKKAVKKKRTKK